MHMTIRPEPISSVSLTDQPTAQLATIVGALGGYRLAMIEEMEKRVDIYDFIASRQGTTYRPYQKPELDKETNDGKS